MRLLLLKQLRMQLRPHAVTQLPTKLTHTCHPHTVGTVALEAAVHTAIFIQVDYNRLYIRSARSWHTGFHTLLI
jgi:hypothetical protein